MTIALKKKIEKLKGVKESVPEAEYTTKKYARKKNNKVITWIGILAKEEDPLYTVHTSNMIAAYDLVYEST
jgi:hypothetical protein